MDIFKIIGALGIVLISIAILVKSRTKRNILYIAGGICLEIYSISIKDAVFIILQIIFTGVAVFDLIKTMSKKEK